MSRNIVHMQAAAYLFAVAILLLPARVHISARRLTLRPLTGREVYRLLREAGRSDAIPQGRVITQGLAFAGPTHTGKSSVSSATPVHAASSMHVRNLASKLRFSDQASKRQIPLIKGNSLQLRQFNLNGLQLPQLSASTFQLPQFNLNALQLPQFNASAFQLPQFNLNSLQLPQFNTSTLQLPQFNPNAFQLPQLNFGNMQLPQIFTANRVSTPAVAVRYEEQEICFSSHNARRQRKTQTVRYNVDNDEQGRQSPTTTSTATDLDTDTASGTGTGTGTGTATDEEISDSIDTVISQDPPATTCIVLRTPTTRN